MTPSKWRYATLISVLLVCAALVTLTMRLRQSENAREALRQAVKAQAQAIQVNRDVVSELCRTNGIIGGLVSEAKDLRQAELDAHKVPRELVQRYELNIAIYEGYIDQLDQQTACREVVRP